MEHRLTFSGPEMTVGPSGKKGRWDRFIRDLPRFLGDTFDRYFLLRVVIIVFKLTRSLDMFAQPGYSFIISLMEFLVFKIVGFGQFVSLVLLNMFIFQKFNG